MLFEILGNLFLVACFISPFILEANKCAEENNRTLWEELFDED